MESESNQSPSAALVTGATGLLGSHIAEQLRQRNVSVRALCRPGSETGFLTKIGVEIVAGDLTDPGTLEAACVGVDVVYHAAAKVGDWGRWSEFVRVSVDGTAGLLAAAAAAKVRRFLHISSISVYGHLNGEGCVFDERTPLGTNVNQWSYYTRAKIAAEKLVWKMHESGKIGVTVIRPSWLYGPRDRATMSRLIDSIRRGKIKLIGDGKNRLNVVHAANVAEGAILAAGSEKASGQAYNVCHDGVLLQRDYFNLIARALGEKEVTRSVPYSVARGAAFVMEFFGHLFQTVKPPLATRYAIWLMGRRCFFECTKIKEHLGWSPTISYEEGIPLAVQDCLETGRAAASAIPHPARSE